MERTKKKYGEKHGMARFVKKTFPAFTLAELIVVVTVLAILAAV